MSIKDLTAEQLEWLKENFCHQEPGTGRRTWDIAQKCHQNGKDAWAVEDQ